MKRKFRLRDTRSFGKVMQGRRPQAGRNLVLYWRRHEGALRVGVAVSRQARGSVLRNRVKRRLRELARGEILERVPSGDIVLIGRVSAASASFQELEEELSRHLRKLSV